MLHWALLPHKKVVLTIDFTELNLFKWIHSSKPKHLNLKLTQIITSIFQKKHFISAFINYGLTSGQVDTRLRGTIFWTYCEKHKVLLVVLPNTVIDPGAVVVHFPYAAFANTEQERARLAARTVTFKTSEKLAMHIPNIILQDDGITGQSGAH